MAENNASTDMPDGKPRCKWPTGDELYLKYHDTEWGMPVTDDNLLFQKICLEGFQSGLSWLTILRKRENFRKAFYKFEIAKVAKMTDKDVERLLQDEGIIRHRGKINSTINNANRALELIKEQGSLAKYFWSFEPGPEDRPALITHESIPGFTDESVALSKDLKKRGWSFVGPTTAYAFMQAMGMVNDHIEGCFCREIIEEKRKNLKRP